MIELRDYQKAIINELYAAWEHGARSIMCQMPTGTGKTVVAVSVIKDKTLSVSQTDISPVERGRTNSFSKVLVVAHRKEILEQIRETLAKYGLGDRLADGSIVVESIQKFSKGLMTNGKTLAPRANAQDMTNEEASGIVADDSTGELLSTGGVGDDSTAQLLSTNAVAVVDSGTPKKERERINKEYREGKIRILVNCDIYSEGYDAPFVEFIQLARPTLSLTKYLQQVGRGLRSNEGKEKTVILDNVGLYYMFGLPNEDRNWARMFREGQILPAIKETSDTGEVAYFYRANINNCELNIDGGHDNDMVVVMKHDELAQHLGYDNEYRKVLHKIDHNSIGDITDRPDQMHCVYFYKDGEFTEKNDSVTCTRWDEVNGKVNAKWYETFYEDYKATMRRLLQYDGSKNEKTNKESSRTTEKERISSVPLLRWTKDKNTRLYGSKTWGEVEIPPMYTRVDECNDNYAIVRKKRTNGLLINRRNEIVYGDANTDVHNLCRGDFALVSKLNSNNIDEKFFVDIRDKNFRMYKCSHGFPSRKTFGGVEFVELDGIAYLNHPKHNNVHILGLNMQFDDDGVFHSERIPGEEQSSNSEVVMFEEMQGEVFVVKGEHRQGGLILSSINDMRSFYHWSGNHKERPMKCNINQRTLLLYMKTRA